MKHVLSLTLALFAAVALPNFALAERDLSKLDVINGGYPHAFFFRSCEGMAANKSVSYEKWDKTFSRLSGIIGKCLDEEVIGRGDRNPEFFSRFKKAHPNQAVLLHFNGNARDPRFRRDRFFDGHWVYGAAVNLTRPMKAEGGEVDIQVSDTTRFRTNMGRYQTSNDDIGICLRNADGTLNWFESEQVQLVSVDHAKKTLRVRRGAYGSKPRAFPKGAAVAPHVTEGPWGARNNIMWFYNYSTTCPRDADGRQAKDALIDDLAEWFGPGGELEAYDGLEFDVLHNHAMGMLPDVNADGTADKGVVDGVDVYQAGVVTFIRELRERMGDNFIIQADGHSVRSQRAFTLLNGIESEGWPDLRDARIEDWNGGMNRHLYWAETSRKPVFNYINHKFNESTEKPGVMRRPKTPWSTHRLVMAAGVFTDAAICYAFTPPPDENGMIGVWDELWAGTEQRLGWLGQPITPTTRMAMDEKNRLGDLASIAKQLKGRGVSISMDGDAIRLEAKAPPTDRMVLTLPKAPCDGPDLTVSLRARGEPMADCPPEVARLTYVGAGSGDLALTRPDLPERGVKVRGAEAEVDLINGLGGRVSWNQRITIGGETHAGYDIHPPYKNGKGYVFWQRVVDLPEGKVSLRYFTGMSEKSPSRSDGIWYQVFIAEINDNGKTGKLEKINETDQNAYEWRKHEVDLSRWAGKGVLLKFVADCGPNDNATTDQGRWGDVEIVTSVKRATTRPERYMTWTGPQAFTSGFYFSNINSPTVDITLEFEGSEPIWIEALSAHAAPDAVYREFEKGIVIANPGPREVTFGLGKIAPGKQFRRIQASSKQDTVTNDGKSVGAKVTLGPKDALFLATR